MGCWDENIYGGDNALDAREKIYDICGAEEYDSNEELKPIELDTLKSKMVELQDYLDKQDEEEKNIGYLVLGAIIMHSGSHFSEPLMDRVNIAITNDDWADDNPLRALAMKNYRKIIKEYDGNSFNIESVDLRENTEPTAADLMSEEFQQFYGILAARTAKLERNAEETSGVKEYDEGVADANEEEINFLAELKELVERYEQFGNLMEKIEDGINNGFPAVSNQLSGAKLSYGGSSGGGKDIMPG